MNYILLLLVPVMLCLPLRMAAQPTDEKAEIMKVAHQFFEALEKQDTLTFKRIMMKNSNSYMVIEGKDSVRLIGRPHNNFNLKPDHIVKERMRKSEMIFTIHKIFFKQKTAYELWVNDKYSHCGVDVFIMLKGN